MLMLVARQSRWTRGCHRLIAHKSMTQCHRKHDLNACLRRCFSITPVKFHQTGTNRRIFSGIQPTGTLHLGNYFGAVRQWVDFQNNGEDIMCCIVDLHAITMLHKPQELQKNILNMAASLIACGIDPNKSILFQQSQVPEHSRLNWVLNCITTIDRLKRQPQFKDKSASLKVIPMGLFSYPVLQAADILLYKATHVPVGKDQEQHISLAAELARKFNVVYGETFTPPMFLTLDENLSKIKSLRTPEKKMSKSEVNAKSRIELTDAPDDVVNKIKKAKSDFTSKVYFDDENRPGVSNLMTIHRAITGKSYSEITQEVSDFDTLQYKFMLADIVNELLNPIQKKMSELLADEGYLQSLVSMGNMKAQERATVTWDEINKKVGFSI